MGTRRTSRRGVPSRAKIKRKNRAIISCIFCIWVKRRRFSRVDDRGDLGKRGKRRARAREKSRKKKGVVTLEK